MSKVFFTTPVGRLIEGNLYRGQDKDGDGNPLVTKSGVNAGKPRLNFFFGLAIPKAGESHWNQTEWGAKIWAEGKTAHAQAHLSPAFAWKVGDGDSTVPNQKGNRLCDKDGAAGHWILRYSSSFAPKIYGDGGGTIFPEVDRVKTGHYVQVYGSVEGNSSTSKPGVYLNHSMVCFVDFGPEISSSVAATSVGFAAQRTETPAPAFAAARTPVVPVVPVVPSAAILNVPAAAPAHVMLPAAGAVTYDQFISAGWTDVQLVQNGMMAA